jgi:regulator of sigma E protease
MINLAQGLFSYNSLLSVLGVVFALGIVILVHEFGHYIACILLKIRVEEFSIGFGKPLKQWKKNKTVYSLMAIPVGGYVKPAGEFYAAEAKIKRKYEFAAKPWWARAVMAFAGAGMNYVLAFIIFFIMVFSLGLPVSNPKLIPTVVGQIMEGYPAQSAGIRKGDKIMSVNKTPVNNWQELVESIDKSASDVITVSYLQNGIENIVNLRLGKDKKIGVAVNPPYRKAGFFEAAYVGAHQCYYWTALSLTTIWNKIVKEKKAPDMAGPIGIFEIVGKGVHNGAADYFFLIALISLAIGMFNLFPIPVLDGGHIVFFIWEGITRKKIKAKILDNLTSCGAAFLILLVLYASYGDIMRIKNRSAAARAAAQKL